MQFLRNLIGYVLLEIIGWISAAIGIISLIVFIVISALAFRYLQDFASTPMATLLSIMAGGATAILLWMLSEMFRWLSD